MMPLVSTLRMTNAPWSTMNRLPLASTAQRMGMVIAVSGPRVAPPPPAFPHRPVPRHCRNRSRRDLAHPLIALIGHINVARRAHAHAERSAQLRLRRRLGIPAESGNTRSRKGCDHAIRVHLAHTVIEFLGQG